MVIIFANDQYSDITGANAAREWPMFSMAGCGTLTLPPLTPNGNVHMYTAS